MNGRIFAAVLFLIMSFPPLLAAQTSNATVTGFVTDQSKALIVGAKVDVVNMDTNIHYAAATNQEGIYTASNLPPGPYRIVVERPGFKTVVKSDVILHVQDTAAINFEMALGSASEIVTVQAGGLVINTTDAAVSTVVDRNFAENLPMNGRSFQTLIQLTPGVVLTASSAIDQGQFSVNGQRGVSNYWMVDGVSANIGNGVSSSSLPGNGFAGSVGSFSAQGGTNSLVSIDAMQEFRIETSTYAPEFGRTPGGQISIATRSGTNSFHGSVFDYFRNNVLDASNWFNGYTNSPPLAKAEERQNDFGGTFSGPVIKDRTFFFFSYEGLRLRLPQTTLSTVPDLTARQNALPALQPYLNAFPLPSPNGADDLATGVAQFNASYSNGSTLNAYSLRADHKLNSKVNLFARYNYSPSEITQRGLSIFALSVQQPNKIITQTATAGVTWAISPSIVNDFRFNYSRVGAGTYSYLDDFGGAVPLTSLPLPSPFTAQNATFNFYVLSLTQPSLNVGKGINTVLKQYNLVDGLSVQKGAHSLKFGVDFRRLRPTYDPYSYYQSVLFPDVPSAATGNFEFGETLAYNNPSFLLTNLGVYAQDTWHVTSRLALTYGLRWDVDFAPETTSGPSFPAALNFNDPANLALAPDGTPAFKTPYGNVAPRLGAAYQLSQNPNRGTVIRGGFGVFYDLATSEVGNLVGQAGYPFSAINIINGSNFPLDPANAAPPPITPASLASGTLSAYYPHFQLPYTLEWNVAVEQELGKDQTLSVSYLGSSGKRLLMSEFLIPVNANIGLADLLTNAGSSDYNALQAQFQRRLSRGLQALASYTWSHSIDTGSAGSFVNYANALDPTGSANANRGSSDFDIRNSFSAGLSYDVPSPDINRIARTVLRGWSLENVIQARSALPVNPYDGLFSFFHNGLADIRPDAVPGEPIYLNGAQCAAAFTVPECPGGKGFNPAAFTAPPTDASGNPLRQGNFGRNSLRGFGAAQWDFAVHRTFPIHESLNLQFRAEMFNLLNRPNFAPPVSDINNPQFGLSNEMLGQYLSGGAVGSGSFSTLYQIGGPRSIQFALKLTF
jgi:hypothetical protein